MHTHISFDHITLLFYHPCLAYGTFPDAWTPVICLSSCLFITATHLCLKIFTLVCYSDLEYSSLSSSQTTMSLNNLHWISLHYCWILYRNVIFSIPIFYYRLMVVISLSILLPASVISRQWNGFVIHLSLFKCHLCQYRHFLIHFILNSVTQSGKSDSNYKWKLSSFNSHFIKSTEAVFGR